MFGPNHQDVTTIIDEVEWAISITTRFDNGEPVDEGNLQKACDIYERAGAWKSQKRQLQLGWMVRNARRYSAN